MVSLQFTPSSRHPVETPLNTPKTPLHTACLNYTPFPAYAIIVPFHMRTKHTSSRWGSWVNRNCSSGIKPPCAQMVLPKTRDGAHEGRTAPPPTTEHRSMKDKAGGAFIPPPTPWLIQSILESPPISHPCYPIMEFGNWGIFSEARLKNAIKSTTTLQQLTSSLQTWIQMTYQLMTMRLPPRFINLIFVTTISNWKFLIWV